MDLFEQASPSANNKHVFCDFFTNIFVVHLDNKLHVFIMNHLKAFKHTLKFSSFIVAISQLLGIAYNPSVIVIP